MPSWSRRSGGTAVSSHQPGELFIFCVFSSLARTGNKVTRRSSVTSHRRVFFFLFSLSSSNRGYIKFRGGLLISSPGVFGGGGGGGSSNRRSKSVSGGLFSPSAGFFFVLRFFGGEGLEQVMICSFFDLVQSVSSLHPQDSSTRMHSC